MPPITAADREGARRPASGHAAHDLRPHHFVLFDRVEAWREDDRTAHAWAVHGWLGGDVSRVWLRSEGERAGGRTEHADIELLYGRSVTPWWDLVAGVRHDFGDAPSQTFAAFGVQGLAPYKIEVEATAYLGQGGQSALRLEAEYETLLTGRMAIQWNAGAEAWGRDDARRGIGAGLDTLELGARLRYEIRREVAPYVGIAWERRFGDAVDLLRAEGRDPADVRWVAGLRFWF